MSAYLSKQLTKTGKNLKVVEGRKLEVTRISMGAQASFSKVSADQSHPVTEKLEKPVFPKVE